MALFQTLRNLFTGKKKKEEQFAQMMRSSTSDLPDYLAHVDKKGFDSLECFRKLGLDQAQSWLNERSRELFKDDPQAKMDFCRRFRYGRVSSLPAEQRSAMAVYFAAFSYFLLEKDAQSAEKEMAQETGKLGQIQKTARREMAKAERDMASTEREMKKVEQAIDQMNAQMARMISGRSPHD